MHTRSILLFAAQAMGTTLLVLLACWLVLQGLDAIRPPLVPDHICRNWDTGVSVAADRSGDALRYRDGNGLERTIDNSNADHWRCESVAH